MMTEAHNLGDRERKKRTRQTMEANGKAKTQMKQEWLRTMNLKGMVSPSASKPLSRIGFGLNEMVTHDVCVQIAMSAAVPTHRSCIAARPTSIPIA